MQTGLFDKNGTPINIGDRTRLVLDDGEVRVFDVCFKTVKRTTIKTFPEFEPETTEVSITGIFFCGEGYDLLPCVDENGISDVSKMEVIEKNHSLRKAVEMIKDDDGHYVPLDCCTMTNPRTSGGVSLIDEIELPCGWDCLRDCNNCIIQKVMDDYGELTQH